MATWTLGFDLWKNGDPEGNAAELARQSLRFTPDANSASAVLSIELLAWIAGSRGEHDQRGPLARHCRDAVAVPGSAYRQRLPAVCPVLERRAGLQR